MAMTSPSPMRTVVSAVRLVMIGKLLGPVPVTSPTSGLMVQMTLLTRISPDDGLLLVRQPQQLV